MSLFGELSAPLDGARGCKNSGSCDIEASMRPTVTRTAELGGRLRTAATLAKMGQQDGHGRRDGMAVAWVPTLAVDSDAATMAG